MSRYRIFGFVLACLLLIGAGCAALQTSAVPSMTMQSSGGDSGRLPSVSSFAGGLNPDYNLTSADAEELLAQQDEEKFMRDAYQAFAATYLTVPFFDGMALSADGLLNYGNRMVPYDTSLEPGMYEHGDLHQLYQQYIGNAGPDTTDAYTTAATLEDRHISGLLLAMSSTSNPALQDLYGRELSVARNNLRTVVRRLDAQGIAYTPQYMSSLTYAEILRAGNENVNLPTEPAATTASYAGAGIVPETSGIQIRFADLPSASLNASEREDVLYFQEFEKYERDLYQSLASENPELPLLRTLAGSADAEMKADDVILRKYAINATPLDPGVFSRPGLQYNYNNLAGTISVLPTEIYDAAAQSEDMHIADLSAAIRRTDNPDLQVIYSHQLSLARNSFRQIVDEIRTRGGTYPPQYISMDYYNSILGSPVEPVG